MPALTATGLEEGSGEGMGIRSFSSSKVSDIAHMSSSSWGTMDSRTRWGIMGSRTKWVTPLEGGTMHSGVRCSES